MTATDETLLDLLVHRMTWEADGVLSVELTHPDGKPLPAWEPGAHLDVHVGGQVRQYSLCSDPRTPASYRIGVLNEPSSRGGSRHVHTKLRPGGRVTVSAPRNHFALEDAPGYVFVAGGIGVTPILAMAREAARRGAEWRMVYGGRSRASMAFVDELTALGGDLTVVPQDERGHIDLASLSPGCRTGPSSTAAVPSRCSPPSRPSARRTGCASSGSRPRSSSGPRTTRASRSSAAPPGSRSPSAPTPRSWRRRRRPAWTWPAPAVTGSAGPARPGCSTARRTTATSCSPTPSGPRAPR